MNLRCRFNPHRRRADAQQSRRQRSVLAKAQELPRVGPEVPQPAARRAAAHMASQRQCRCRPMPPRRRAYGCLQSVTGISAGPIAGLVVETVRTMSSPNLLFRSTNPKTGCNYYPVTEMRDRRAVNGGGNRRYMTTAAPKLRQSPYSTPIHGLGGAGRSQLPAVKCLRSRQGLS